MAYCVVTMSAPCGEPAKALARALVERKLAACVQRVPGAESVYWWKGAVETQAEDLLVAKTDKVKVKALVRAVRELHPYAVPEVLALRVKEGHREYLRWISESLGTPRKKVRIPAGKPRAPRVRAGEGEGGTRG